MLLPAKKKRWRRFLLFDYSEITVSEKWKFIGKIMALNALFVPILAAISYYIYGKKIGPILAYPSFFLPLNKFHVFFQSSVFEAAVLEEMTYRLWVWLFAANLVTITIRNKNCSPVFLWLAIIIPTVVWAASIHPIVPPVLFAGLTWGWLVAKTRSLWPAVVSHGLSNAAIYLVIKIVNIIAPQFIKNL